MADWTVYDAATGQITRKIVAPEMPVALRPGEAVWPEPGWINGDTKYILDGVITDRPPNPALDLSRGRFQGGNLPEGTTIYITDKATGGVSQYDRLASVRLAPGSYTFEVHSPFPYLPYSRDFDIA